PLPPGLLDRPRVRAVRRRRRGDRLVAAILAAARAASRLLLRRSRRAAVLGRSLGLAEAALRDVDDRTEDDRPGRRRRLLLAVPTAARAPARALLRRRLCVVALDGLLGHRLIRDLRDLRDLGRLGRLLGRRPPRARRLLGLRLRGQRLLR